MVRIDFSPITNDPWYSKLKTFSKEIDPLTQFSDSLVVQIKIFSKLIFSQQILLFVCLLLLSPICVPVPRQLSRCIFEWPFLSVPPAFRVHQPCSFQRTIALLLSFAVQCRRPINSILSAHFLNLNKKTYLLSTICCMVQLGEGGNVSKIFTESIPPFNFRAEPVC